jgi:hypothetical protein
LAGITHSSAITRSFESTEEYGLRQSWL